MKVPGCVLNMKDASNLKVTVVHPAKFVLPTPPHQTGVHENTSPFFTFSELRNSPSFKNKL